MSADMTIHEVLDRLTEYLARYDDEYVLMRLRDLLAKEQAGV